MTRYLYTVILRLFAPFIWLWMRIRAGKEYRPWGILAASRFGRYAGERGEADEAGRVWVHAVSLGETRAAQPLIQAILDRGLRVLLTHTTPTGLAEGQRLFSAALASNQLRQAWLPYDFPGAVRRFFTFFAPRFGILIEREVWPNLIYEAVKQGISVVLVSARLSEAGLRRSQWARRALRRAYASLDLVLAQTQADADRLRQIGAYGPHVAGNLKFDVALSPHQLEAGRVWKGALGRPVIAIASTREGEDDMFAAGIAKAFGGEPDKGPLHMLIPRHPQRFDDAGKILVRYGLPFVRRSADANPPPPHVPVLLGDTLGEMGFYYAAADVAIIGGGFAPMGGQNLIEACAAGTPVIVGPHMHNFAQATEDALAAGAAIRVSDAAEALKVAAELLGDDVRLRGMQEAARIWASSHAGATQRIMEALRPWLGAEDTRDRERSAPHR